MQMVQEKKLLLNIGGSFVVDCRKDDIDPMTKGMIMMWGVFAEMERDIISSRIKSGMENAKAKGSKIGRPERTIDNLPVSFLKYYPMLQNGSINISEFARLSGLGRTSIYRYLNLIEKK
jgi:DNA invertase Pin-like site-specific DNA recombinase